MRYLERKLRFRDNDGPAASLDGAAVLSDIRPGQRVRVVSLNASRPLMRRLRGMGLHRHALLDVLHWHRSAIVTRIGGVRLALGRDLAALVGVTRVP